MQRLDRWVAAIWKEHKIWGFVIIVAVLLVVLVVAALVLGIDVAGLFEDGINTLRVNWNG